MFATSDFDPINEGVRELICVHRDVHWLLPEEQLITAIVNGTETVVLRSILKDFCE